ncbi:MAG: hypothetical protein ACREEM_41440 [Blastocatellia bacterium]
METHPDQITRIILPARLTDDQQRLLVKYLRLPRSLSRQEWAQALAAFDLLHEGRVQCGDETMTFQQFYPRAIDSLHANAFIDELLGATDAGIAGKHLTEKYWREINTGLAALGVVGATAEERALLVYCLYWWRSFCKGYSREVAVFRDLERSGVEFEAHDLRAPASRRTVYDLIVLGRWGDVKNSTYFIHTARSFPLRCDFYIARLWDETADRWLDLVLLKPEAWHELNGEPTPCSWEAVQQVLPAAAEIVLRGEALIVVPYEKWKACVLRRQARERKDTTE